MAEASIILDTNVLVAGLRSKLGASALVLELVGRGLIELNLSVPVVLEYEAVLKRPGMVPAYTAGELDEVIDGLCAVAQHRRIFFLWRPQLTDPKDEAVLELAEAAERASIVTHNVNHFRGAERFGVEVLTPVQILTQIGALE